MNVTVKATGRTFTGLDATTAALLSECGLVTINKRASTAIEDADIVGWVRRVYKARPTPAAYYGAAFAQFPEAQKLTGDDLRRFKDRVRAAFTHAGLPAK